MLLYDKPECPFCFKVRIALAEQGRDFHHRPHDAPGVVEERRRLSPTGTVPIVVLDDGYVMSESNVIMEYLANALGGGPYFAGEYSLADAALTARFALAHAYGLGVAGEFDSLRDWFARVTGRPSFEVSAPPAVLRQVGSHS